MPRLSDLTLSIRSKNAGPFWVTIDLFFKDNDMFETVSKMLDTQAVANVLNLELNQLERFDLPDIRVIKVSFPRTVVQGHRFDRDMHGAQYAWLLYDIDIVQIS